MGPVGWKILKINFRSNPRWPMHYSSSGFKMGRDVWNLKRWANATVKVWCNVQLCRPQIWAA